MAMTATPTSEAWHALVAPLGLAGVAEGQHVAAPSGAPRLSAVVERVGSAEHPELLLRLDQPAPGLGHMFAMPMGGQTCLPLRIYLYGQGAAETAAREQAAWQTWFEEQFRATV
jgi:hypothetical protein